MRCAAQLLEAPPALLVACDEAVDVHGGVAADPRGRGGYRYRSHAMATLERGIVTPEAVVLEFDTAGIAVAGTARTIDVLIQAGLLFVLILVAVTGIGGDGWAAWCW